MFGGGVVLRARNTSLARNPATEPCWGAAAHKDLQGGGLSLASTHGNNHVQITTITAATSIALACTTLFRHRSLNSPRLLLTRITADVSAMTHPFRNYKRLSAPRR